MLGCARSHVDGHIGLMRQVWDGRSEGEFGLGDLLALILFLDSVRVLYFICSDADFDVWSWRVGGDRE